MSSKNSVTLTSVSETCVLLPPASSSRTSPSVPRVPSIIRTMTFVGVASDKEIGTVFIVSYMGQGRGR